MIKCFKKPDVAELTERGVLFEDGTGETVDAMFYCTGKLERDGNASNDTKGVGRLFSSRGGRANSRNGQLDGRLLVACLNPFCGANLIKSLKLKFNSTHFF